MLPSETVVMVTGGSGLVGMALQEYIQKSDSSEHESWVFLSSKDGDLRDRVATEAIFQRVRPTHVIHLAAKVGGLFANMVQKVTRHDFSYIYRHVCQDFTLTHFTHTRNVVG